METNVLPFLSTQKRPRGGQGEEKLRKKKQLGFFKGLLTLPSHLQGLDAC